MPPGRRRLGLRTCMWTRRSRPRLLITGLGLTRASRPRTGTGPPAARRRASAVTVEALSTKPSTTQKPRKPSTIVRIARYLASCRSRSVVVSSAAAGRTWRMRSHAASKRRAPAARRSSYFSTRARESGARSAPRARGAGHLRHLPRPGAGLDVRQGFWHGKGGGPFARVEASPLSTPVEEGPSPLTPAQEGPSHAARRGRAAAPAESTLAARWS